jgi:hypothetical protein
MGRTLHFTLKLQNKITDKQAQIMQDISDKYNSGAMEKAWTCENFYFTPYAYYPAWKNYGGTVDSWEEVDVFYKRLQKEGLNHIAIIKQLVKDKVVNLHNEISNEVSGFCKTQGNELNSLMVYTALLEISRAIPKANIHLYDEGEFLYCDVDIKNGLVKPDLDSIKKDIKHWSTNIAFSSNTKVMQGIKKDIYNDISDEDKRELGISDYGSEYLRDNLNKFKTVMHILRENWTEDYQVNSYNLRSYKGFDPDLFHRRVDIEKFKDYKMSPATIMDGFRGEGFGLTDDSAEGESYKMIGMIQSMFEGKSGGKLEILGADNE